MKWYRMRPFAFRGLYSRAFVLLADLTSVRRAERMFAWLMTHGVIARETARPVYPSDSDITGDYGDPIR